MWSYILKRILLMIPTLLGVLTLTFAVIQFVPGGPVEQAVHELRAWRGPGPEFRHALAYRRGCAAGGSTQGLVWLRQTARCNVTS